MKIPNFYRLDRHFLQRGLDRVRGEWSLMALCYNFTRVPTPDHSPGLHRFMAYLAKCKPDWTNSLLNAAIASPAASEPAWRVSAPRSAGTPQLVDKI